MNLVVVYLASPREAYWKHWTRLDCLHASIALLRKHLRPLPVIIFHEDFTHEDQDRLRIGEVAFERVDFRGQEDAFVNHRPDNRVGSYGYCMMCRFFSGILQRHPLLKTFSHYMRLDDDSYLIQPIGNDVLDRLMSFDYSYNSTFSDPHKQLWAFTRQFMEQEGLGVLDYNENVPYTNFHVSSLALWRHPVVERYVDAIENERGCLRFKWDDAQIQAMIAYGLAPALGFSVNLEKDFPYRHNQQCVHSGPHTIYCEDGYDKAYPWGPPAQVVKGTRN